MKLKKMLCAVLTLCLLLSALPVTALAIQPETESLPSMQLHMDAVRLDKAEGDENDYSGTNTDRALALRAGLVARDTEIKICFTTFQYDDESLLESANRFLADALELTDGPAEGDYLFYSLGEISVSVEGYVENDQGYITLLYHPTYSTTAAQEQELNETVQAILDELDVYDTYDLAKIEAIYDYICANASYAGAVTSSTPLYRGSAHAALKDAAVSYGFAQLFYRLAMELDVNTRMICGEVNGSDHCWNLVKIGKYYYNLDAALDAGSSDYRYFLMSNNGMADHVRYDEFNTDSFNKTYPMDGVDYADDELIKASGRFGNEVNWEMGHRGTVTVTGTGKMFNYTGRQETPMFDHYEKVTNIVIGDGITTVGDYVFHSCKTQRVTIGNDVTSIGHDAFNGCDKLCEIYIPGNVTTIGDSAFAQGYALNRAILAEGVETIGNHAFTNCNNLHTLALPDTLTTIGASAFYGTALTEVALPDSLTYIDEQAFYGTKLNTISIPAAVSYLGDQVFQHCASLEEILVDSDNQHYTSIDGVVYDIGVTTVKAAPGGKSGALTIPDTVTSIPRYTFDNCRKLTEITIGKAVTDLGDGAFYNCENVKKVYFRGPAPTFGGNAVFESVTASVFYPAGDETWTEEVRQNYGGTLSWVPYCPDGHVPEVRDAVAPTCTEEGYSGDEYCAVCGEPISRGTAVPALGHTVETEVITAATCTEPGEAMQTCTVCGESYSEVIPALGHTPDAFQVTAEPTCTEDGAQSAVCTICGESYTEAIPALGHTLENCTDNEDGLTHTGICSLCGETIPDAPHNNADGSCTDCGALSLQAPTIVSCYSKLQTSVKVTWELAAGADGYELWRSTTPDDDGSWTKTKTISSGTTDRYTNQGLTVGQTYYYKVRAYIVNSSGDKIYSDFSNVDYMPAAVVFDAPYSNSPDRIRLRWNEIDGAHGYQIWRRQEYTDYQIVKTLGDKGNVLTNDQGATTAYSNNGLEAAQVYIYKMRAFRITDDGRKIFGAYSDEYRVAVMPHQTTVRATSYRAGSIEIRWEDYWDESGYQVWMSTEEDGTYSIIKTLGENENHYEKNGLTSGQTYYFKVRAFVELDGKKTFAPFSNIVGAVAQ